MDGGKNTLALTIKLTENRTRKKEDWNFIDVKVPGIVKKSEWTGEAGL